MVIYTFAPQLQKLLSKDNREVKVIYLMVKNIVQ